jgi:hypothetical protein
MKTLKTIIYILILLAGVFFFLRTEIQGRSNIRSLGRMIHSDSSMLLYTGNNIEITSIDSLAVKTVFPTGVIKVTRGIHEVKVKFSKQRFYIIQTNETYAHFTFNLNFRDYGPYTFVGFENKADNKIYFETLPGAAKEAEQFYKDSIVPAILASSKAD